MWGASFLIVWTSLMLCPPIAILIFNLTRREFPWIVRPTAIASAITIVFTAGFALIGVAFHSVLANIVWLSALYLPYCYLAGFCWETHASGIKIAAKIIFTLSIGAGYVVGTIGFVELASCVGDYTNPAIKTMQISNNLECRDNIFGMAGVDAGETVSLYQVNWLGLSFLERKISSVTSNDNFDSEWLLNPTCHNVLASHTNNSGI